MNTIHDKNLIFLDKYLRKSPFDWLDYEKPIKISYFSSGGGTHLYLIINGNKKFIARINFFPGKNDWKVKRREFKVLKEIESLNISPKAYLLNEKNSLKQDFTIVEYIEGKNISKLKNSDIINLAKILKKLHSFNNSFNKKKELPYKCSIFNEFADGEDKKIENYKYPQIKSVVKKYNLIKENLGEWFNGLLIFDDCKNLCLCHGDLKSENILRTKKGIALIDWECADLDIPETDIGRLFSGCQFNERQQNVFLKEYFRKAASDDILNRIMSVKIVLDFFRIIEDYCIHQRKEFVAKEMIKDFNHFQDALEKFKKSQSSYK